MILRRSISSRLLILGIFLGVLFLPGCRTWSGREERAVVAYNQALAFSQSGNDLAASESFEEALRIWPDFPLARYNLALIDIRLERFEKGLSGLNVLLEEDPGNLIFLRSLGWAHWRSGDVVSALAAYERALAIFEADQPSLRSTAEILEFQGDFRSAVTYRRNLYRLTQSKDDKKLLADLLAQLGEVVEAINLYEELLIENPRNAEVLEQAALTAEDSGDYVISAGYWLELSEMVGDTSSRAFWNLARIRLLHLGDYGGGIEALREGVEANLALSQEEKRTFLEEVPPIIRTPVVDLFALMPEDTDMEPVVATEEDDGAPGINRGS